MHRDLLQKASAEGSSKEVARDLSLEVRPVNFRSVLRPLGSHGRETEMDDDLMF